jgi:hypothetical protein
MQAHIEYHLGQVFDKLISSGIALISRRRFGVYSNAKTKGVARFFQETGIKETDWAGKFWVRWGDALREAGFEPNQFNASYDTTMLIEKFVSSMRELGKFPVRRELQLKKRTDKSFPSANVFERLGSKQELAGKILHYCKGRAVVKALRDSGYTRRCRIGDREQLTIGNHWNTKPQDRSGLDLRSTPNSNTAFSSNRVNVSLKLPWECMGDDHRPDDAANGGGFGGRTASLPKSV